MISRLSCYFHSWIFHNFCFWLFLGERPYRCHVPECGRAIIQLSNLQQHLRNHDAQLERAKNRPFQCAICGKGFATESSLRTHTAKVNIHVVHFHSNSCVCVLCLVHRSLSVCYFDFLYSRVCLSRPLCVPVTLPSLPPQSKKKPLPFEFSIGPSKKWKKKQKTKLCPHKLNVDNSSP